MIEPVHLSEAGSARREAMLGVLGNALAARVRRRRVWRAGGAMAVLLAGVAIVIAVRPVRIAAPTIVAAPAPAPAPSPAPGPAPAAPALAMRYATFREVQTDPRILEGETQSRITVIDDSRLLRELREMGHPTGLIRTRGSVVLTADVAKPPRHDAPSNG